MNIREYQELQDAYQGVYESYLEPNFQKREENNKKAIEDMKKTKAHKDMVATARKKFDEEVETEVFTQVLEYLVAEGYADTNENALAIMANMSEEWRESIVEGEEKEEESQKPFTGEGPKKPKGWRPTGPKLKSGQRPGYAR